MISQHGNKAFLKVLTNILCYSECEYDLKKGKDLKKDNFENEELDGNFSQRSWFYACVFDPVDRAVADRNT